MTTNNATINSCGVTTWGNCEKEAGNRKRSLIVLKDKKATSQYRGLNNTREEFITLLVDDCIIKIQTQRKCDYLLLDNKNKVARLIELKGVDYNHGVEQIKDTMRALGKQLKTMGYNKFLARIAASRSPHIKDADYKKLKDAIYAEFKMLLEIKGNNLFEEKLS